MKSAVKRVISMIPVLLGVMLLIFIMLRIVPGDPVTVLLGEHYSQETIDRLTAAMKLDRPLLEQFISYVLGVLKGDLGISYVSKRPVTMMILQALPYTVKLALMAAAFAWVIGLFAGIIAAVKENKIPDRIFMAFSLAGVSVPVFMSALLLQYIFAFRLKLFPITSDGSILSMLLPAIALGWNSAGSIARLTSSDAVKGSILEIKAMLSPPFQ